MMSDDKLTLEVDMDRSWLCLLIHAARTPDGTMIDQRSHMPGASPSDAASRKKLALILSRLIRHAWDIACDADAEREGFADLSVREAIRRQWLGESDVDDYGEPVSVCMACGEPQHDAAGCTVCGWIGW